MRRGRVKWTDLDLERGAVRLDKNKTDDPRAWALAPDVACGQSPKDEPVTLNGRDPANVRGFSGCHATPGGPGETVGMIYTHIVGRGPLGVVSPLAR